MTQNNETQTLVTSRLQTRQRFKVNKAARRAKQPLQHPPAEQPRQMKKQPTTSEMTRFLNRIKLVHQAILKTSAPGAVKTEHLEETNQNEPEIVKYTTTRYIMTATVALRVNYRWVVRPSDGQSDMKWAVQDLDADPAPKIKLITSGKPK